jgi:putative ABC transport system ATP-binding protein
MQEIVIKAINLTKVFRDDLSDHIVLEDINLEVYSGEFIGISGVSGTGKSTFLSIIGGLEKATKGSLELFGENIDQMNDKQISDIRLNNIGFIFQEHNLLPALTVYENIELPLLLAKIQKKERLQRVRELLLIVGLEDLGKRYPSQLSRGQRQRIAAIRAFANNPKIILADEPTSDLDKDNAQILLTFLKTLNKEYGTTIIILATNPEVFIEYTSRNMRLEENRLYSY